MTPDAATSLLDDFRKLPGRVERPRTFMEIAGYPHYENVCSNILAFFMDPTESHGLGTLVLDALVSAAGIEVSEGPINSNVSIDREVVTYAGNRIDLLVVSDDHAILIENKIYATVNNPFADYSRYLDLNYGHLAHQKILLTVFPSSEGRKWNFSNLTYERFVVQIRSLLGRYVSTADARHLTMFLDFLNTLENLQRGTRMDREFVQFLAKRENDVRILFDNLKGFRAELRQKVEELQTLIDISQHQSSVEEQGLWRGDTTAMSDNLYFKIRVAKDLLVDIDTHLSPRGWEIQIFARDKGDPLELRNLLDQLEIQFDEKDRFIHKEPFDYDATTTSSPLRARTLRFIHKEPFDYDATLDQIRPVLQDLVDKLATYRGL